MKKSRFTETQIVSVLKEADAGGAITSSGSVGAFTLRVVVVAVAMFTKSYSIKGNCGKRIIYIPIPFWFIRPLL
jgi:hypothetical protein